MEISRDFKELLMLFNAHAVEYMIVGGYALAFHGVPRYTGDLDLFVRTTAENARRIMAAITEFGFGEMGLSEEDFLNPNRIVQFGVPPVRVDLITGIDGVAWEDAHHGKQPGNYAGVPVDYIGRKELVANKKASGRTKDLADVESLDEQ